MCDFGILRHGIDRGAQLGDRPGLGVSRVVGAGAGLHARSVLGGRGGHLPSAPVVGRQRAVCLAAHLANGLCRAGSRAAGVGGLVGPGMAAGVLLPVVRAVRMPLTVGSASVVGGVLFNGQDRCVLIDVVSIAVLERSPTAGALVMFPLACGVAGGGGLRYKHPRVGGMCRRGYHVAALGAELRRSLGGRSAGNVGGQIGDRIAVLALVPVLVFIGLDPLCCVVVVCQLVDGLLRPADFISARRAVHYFIVAARCCAGRRHFVLAHCCTRRVTRGGDRLFLCSAANRAGKGPFARCCAGRRGGHFTFVPAVLGLILNRVTVGVLALVPVVVVVFAPLGVPSMTCDLDFFCLFRAANRAGKGPFARRCTGRRGGHCAFVPVVLR